MIPTLANLCEGFNLKGLKHVLAIRIVFHCVVSGRESAFTLTNQSLPNIQNKPADDRHFHPKYLMTIARHNLRKQLQIADFIRPNEGSDVFIQTIEFQQFFVWNVCDRECTSCNWISRFWAKWWNLYFVCLFRQPGYSWFFDRLQNHLA